MMLDEIGAEKQAEKNASDGPDPLDLAADMERMMVDAGELEAYVGSDTEAGEELQPAAPVAAEPDAAAGHQLHPTGGLLVNNA